MSPPAATSTGQLEHVFARWSVGWHAVFLGLVAVAALAVVAEEGLGSRVTLVTLAILAAIVVLYRVLAWPIMGCEGTVRGTTYVVAAWVGFLAMVAIGSPDQIYFLLFALMPQLWMFLATRWAVAFTFVGVLALTVVQVASNGWKGESFTASLPWAVLQIVVSLLLGLFITGVFNEAERRAGLIDELERTRAELAETEHDRGVLAERQRLSHEIHDTLAQGFTSVLTLAQAIEVALDHGGTDVVRERLHLLERTARENLAEARALVGALAPIDLQSASLSEAVRRVAARFAEQTGLDVDVDISGEPRTLDANAEVVLLRATQEALANVRKHAGANTVRVGLAFLALGTADGAATLAVADDGCGFEPGADDGFGLRGMRARVEQVGGTLEIVSAPGAGTTLHVSVP